MLGGQQNPPGCEDLWGPGRLWGNRGWGKPLWSTGGALEEDRLVGGGQVDRRMGGQEERKEGKKEERRQKERQKEKGKVKKGKNKKKKEKDRKEEIKK